MSHLTSLPTPADITPDAQWVFYLFGASAVLWLPFWLPQRIEGGNLQRRGGGGGGGGKSFNMLDLFSSGDAGDPAGAGPDSGRSARGAAAGDAAEPARLQRVGTALSDDIGESAPCCAVLGRSRQEGGCYRAQDA